MRRLLTFQRLKVLSFTHSAIYLALLVVWLVPGLHAAEFVFGLSHGLGWIAMALLAIVAVRMGIVSLWLAAMIAVIGGLGPFAGSIGFVVEERRTDANRAPKSTR